MGINRRTIKLLRNRKIKQKIYVVFRERLGDEINVFSLGKFSGNRRAEGEEASCDLFSSIKEVRCWRDVDVVNAREELAKDERETVTYQEEKVEKNVE